jgi:regulator of sigma E protease
MWILSILVFVLIFSSLIVVHEWGHFRAARWAGVRAEEFAVGFGKKIFGWKRGETDFRINAVPFGGYVKMTGELMGDDANPDPRSFGAAKLYKRMVITLAGVVMNFLFAIVLLTMLFAHGTEPILVSQADVERAKASGQITIIENENGEKEFTIEEIKF